jgi:hypothetical protein
MLFGSPNLHIYTDHKNHTFQKLQTQRFSRWRLSWKNMAQPSIALMIVTMSLLTLLAVCPFSERQDTTHTHTPQNPADFNRRTSTSEPVSSFFSMAIDEDNLLDCFVHLPAQQSVPFHMNYANIAALQAQDAALVQQAQTNSHKAARILWHPMCTSIVISLNQEVNGRSISLRECSMILYDGIIWPLGTWELHVWPTPLDAFLSSTTARHL